MPGTTLQDIRQVLGGEPVVALDSFFSPELDSILLQNRKAAAIATRHLLNHGYKRVACLTIKPEIYSYRERMNGYTAEMKAHRLPGDLIVANDDVELDEVLRTQLLKRTALKLCLPERHRRAACHEAHQDLRLSLKQLPKVIGFDDFESAPFLEVPLTVIGQPNTRDG